MNTVYTESEIEEQDAPTPETIDRLGPYDVDVLKAELESALKAYNVWHSKIHDHTDSVNSRILFSLIIGKYFSHKQIRKKVKSVLHAHGIKRYLLAYTSNCRFLIYIPAYCIAYTCVEGGTLYAPYIPLTTTTNAIREDFELTEFHIVSQPVVARPRRLRARWTLEPQQDIDADIDMKCVELVQRTLI